jgi:nicotinate-nucleotide pyrophosphorylase (carboxylating)
MCVQLVFATYERENCVDAAWPRGRTTPHCYYGHYSTGRKPNTPELRVAKEFRQVEWDATLEDDCRQMIRLAVREDLDRVFDWTTVSLVPSGTSAEASIVARKAGTIAGLPAVRLALEEMDTRLRLETWAHDAQQVGPGEVIARLAGPARSLLTCERIVLNLLGRLSGIATLTRQYVAAVEGTNARIYDTRKTTPGWRRLEKYAVRMGGGHNHRTGLFDAVLIKDNHLAFTTGQGLTLAEAVRQARRCVESAPKQGHTEQLLIEVEVDTLEQLEQVLAVAPDIVLLDNMRPDELREAVAMRDRLAPHVELEASGGVNLTTVAEIARTGIERISVGALTHSAAALDVGLDWQPK